ncbi:hypothetical protein LJC35_06390 [Parabacteroides sp. OttesenSCG-928-N08]|nr:hypothetical protein [Parabacteroides sp. OttesenSCG-928-N08]
MKRIYIFILGIVFSSLSLASQTEMRYHLSFDPEGQYIHVALSLSNLSTKTTTLRMPVWAPGYYLILDYPKNVVDFEAFDADSNPLIWEKSGKNGWVVNHGGRDMTISYRVYANAQSVAECMVTSEKAFIPGNGVYMHIEKEKNMPVTVHFTLPDTWKHIATGLKRIDEFDTFYATDFDLLYDSPVYLGNPTVLHFTHEGHEYELALEIAEELKEQDFVGDLKKMISSCRALIGDVPYDNYCFILMGNGVGGLEHFNSQACFIDDSLDTQEEYLRFLSFITHEYFHLYNVKTIRPIELGPFDYDREVFTPLLWVSEGFTVYYELPILLRSGVIDKNYFLKTMSDFIRRIESNTGKNHMSLRQSSYDIWLNFFNRNANGADTRISYYDKGPIIGFLMDIEIRYMTENRRSLDDVMRTLYWKYYKEKNRGFTEEEFWQVCADVAGQPLTEMRRYVDTTSAIDYTKYAAYSGLQIDADWNLSIVDGCSGLPLLIRESILGK